MGIADQGMMAITWRLETQHRLQQSLHMRGSEQIVTTRDQRNALVVIIDDDSKVIADTHITTAEYDIAADIRLQRNQAGFSAGTVAGFQEAVQWYCDGLQAGRAIQPDRVGLAGGKPPGPRVVIESATDSGI